MALTMDTRRTEHLEALLLDPGRIPDRVRLGEIQADYSPADFAPPGDSTEHLEAGRLVMPPRHGLTPSQEAAAALRCAQWSEVFVSTPVLYRGSAEFQVLVDLNPGMSRVQVMDQLQPVAVAAAQARVAALS